MTEIVSKPQDFEVPSITLTGPVDQAMYSNVCNQLSDCPDNVLCVVELSILGGDPEVARLSSALGAPGTSRRTAMNERS